MATNSGLPREMPRAPGNAKAGQSPRRAEAGGALPHWLDSGEVLWTKSRVNGMDQRMKAKAAGFQVGEPQLKDIPGFCIL